MNHCIFFAITFILICIKPVYANQIIIKGKVSNIETNEAIPYSTIVLEDSSLGCISDSLGRFTLDIAKNHKDKIIVISALGYKSDSISLNKIILLDSIFISLKPTIFLLEEIKINPKKYRSELLGIEKKSKKSMWNYGVPGMQRAMFFPNKKKLTDFYLKRIKLYIDTIGYPMAPLRIRIYSLEKDENRPKEDLLRRNIIVKNSSGGDFVLIDVEQDQIKFPEEGLFVAIEWLYENDEFYYEKEMVSKDRFFIIKGYGPTLGIALQKNNTSYWVKMVGSDWKDSSQKSKRIQPIMNLELISN